MHVLFHLYCKLHVVTDIFNCFFAILFYKFSKYNERSNYFTEMAYSSEKSKYEQKFERHFHSFDYGLLKTIHRIPL